jgi:hypothetical protein
MALTELERAEQRLNEVKNNAGARHPDIAEKLGLPPEATLGQIAEAMISDRLWWARDRDKTSEDEENNV